MKYQQAEGADKDDGFFGSILELNQQHIKAVRKQAYIGDRKNMIGSLIF
jgi:hypothetical protein